jgi:RNA ligase (TIGR02306 family)
MSTFEVKVLPVKIEVHPGADNLEIARIGDYRSIVRKGDFSNGDHCAYIPEGAVLPDDLIAEMGLTGRLAGSDKNRVKAVKLRGVLSQGLIYPARKGWRKGDDVAAELGIWKYEPVVPAGFQGELMSVGGKRTLNYDIENYKKFPDLFKDGEEVVFTEKIHGTFAMFAVMGKDNLCPGPYSKESWMQDDEDNSYEESRLIIASKGVAAKGLAFKINAEANKNNIYVRTAKSYDILPAVEECFGLNGPSVFLLGEIFGPGVQDLHYGLVKPEFRIFDIYVGKPGEGRFLGDAELSQKCVELDIPRVPVLYRGPFSREILDTYTNGKETGSNGSQVREGVVIRPSIERVADLDFPCYDRLQVKSVSEGYLLRKGDTSEFQ